MPTDRPWRILVVDDNPINIELAADILELAGCQVDSACNGEEALTKVKSDRPDLVLMDLRMPGIDGVEATNLIKNDLETFEIPVVALTASVMKGERERILALGFDGFIEKPILPGTFAQLVLEHLQD